MWLATAAVVVGVVVGYLMVRTESANLAVNVRKLRDRKPLTLMEWNAMAQDCGDVCPAVLEGVLRAIAEVLEVDPMQLRPGERIIEDLTGAFWFSDGAEDPFRWELNDKFGVQWDDRWRTVEDVVHGVVCRKSRV